LYYAYEIAINENLKDLQIRLKGKSYSAKPPIRIYVPKPSGLQRPITLLSLEDQIVWQAVGNIFAQRLSERRSKVELKTVFSNILQRGPNRIFFVRSWKYSYGQFLDTIEDYYKKGYRWIADFDLAAFYDTISHELLLTELHPRGGETELRNTISTWLRAWSADRPMLSRTHGIPQGPISSDFLAECFLLSIDEAMAGASKFRYARYVDDIRLFAKEEAEMRKAAVKLELLCRNKGLIPQGKKYGRKQATTLEEARGSLPSIRVEEDETFHRALTIPKRVAIPKLRQALGGRPQRILDRTRARYVFFNAEPSPELTRYAAKLLLHHPEHIDAFVHYFNYCKRSPIIVRACRTKLRKTPYEYVQGELWHVLARIMKPREMTGLIDKAVDAAKDKSAGFALKWGALHFLCKADSKGLGRYSRFVQFQDSAFLQALLVPAIPDVGYTRNDVIGKIMIRTSYEPGIMLAEQLVARKLTHNSFGCKPSQLPTQVQNVFRRLGIIRGSRATPDPMGEIIASRYGLGIWTGWRKLFASEYVHALQILCSADAVFNSGKSKWLGDQNSFNHALFLALQNHLQKNKLPGVVKLKNKRGDFIKYGVLLDKNQHFSKTYPLIAEGLRVSNDRRNSLPGSHPYKPGGPKTSWLTRKEQNGIKARLKITYEEITKLLPHLQHEWKYWKY
jgi:hypothetical protein